LAGEFHAPRARRALESAESDEVAEEEEVAPAASATPAPATGADATGDESPAAEQVVESPTMLALLHPELPEVRARRARARLESAGELEDANAPTVAPSH
jgi:hypothetical protein